MDAVLSAARRAAGVAVAVGFGFAPTAALAEVPVVVTFDNGEFDLPLYAPRWNGEFARPSAASEIAIGVERAAGSRARVFSYLPGGRVAGLPGQIAEIQPARAGCVGASAVPTDACWCGPGDNCWAGLQVNTHPASSTSLVRSVAAVRDLLGTTPHIEVHLTDLFEEDPSAAEDPSLSDRCVTSTGSARALAAVANGPGIDHLALGVVRVRIAPPPPGAPLGSAYRLVPRDPASPGGCWTGAADGRWASDHAPWDLAMAVVVVGVGTGAEPGVFDAFLAALPKQVGSEDLDLALTALRAPRRERAVARVLALEEAAQLDIPPEGAVAGGCAPEPANVNLATSTGVQVPAVATMRCDGEVALSVPPSGVLRAFLASAKLDPRVDQVQLLGEVVSQAGPAPDLSAAATLAASAADRPLPFWAAAVAELTPQIAHGEQRVALDLTIARLDPRPWRVAAIFGAVGTILVFFLGLLALRRLDADRALHRAWAGATPGADPLRQRPIGVVLAEADARVRARWPIRAIVAASVGVAFGAALFLALMWGSVRG